ncbi:MAG: DnaJ C-terminal domain-containing protein [Phycisphaerae bacterium]|nr:DnaJ C-terminal domain-containing protein [Phycisphaerae bacterium]
MPRDYYEILGVPRSASDDDIRKAHRRLARKFHPDVNKATDATTKFSEAQEAYDILSDKEKRKRYDQFGHAGVSNGATDPYAGGGPFRGAGSRGGSRGSGSGGGPGTRSGPGTSSGGWAGGEGGQWTDIDPENFETIFGDLFGSRGRPGRSGSHASGRTPTPSVGDDIEHTITAPFAVAALGGSESIRITLPDGATQSIEVRIPAGVKPGSKLRVKGKGQPGGSGGPAGDLILTVQVGEHPWFRRDGLDLSLEVPITIAEAALGTVIEVPLLKGSVKLKVPPGTSSGARLRAKGKGISDAKGEAGDFYATIKIVAPESVTDDERVLLDEMNARLPNPRASTRWAGEVGL